MTPQEISSINWIGINFTIAMGILIFFLPRQVSYIPVILSACFMTQGQGITILGFNLYILRITLLLTWIAIFIRGDAVLKFNAIDKVFVCWVIFSIVSYSILYGNLAAFKNRIGFAFNALGLYFLFRCLIRDQVDIDRMIKVLAAVVISLAAFIVIEYLNGRNLFSIFGGVPEFTMIRDGRMRCQGPFRTPILLGTFGATLVPFTVAFWFNKNNPKYFAIAAFIAATFIGFASGSSGPAMTYAAAIIGLTLWPFRRYIKIIVFVIFSSLFVLNTIMEASIWYLMARISGKIGGKGWHRSELIEQAINNFDEWWLIGTSDNSSWMPFGVLPGSPNMVDCTNQYLSEGFNGGFMKLLLFVIIIALCFQRLGKAMSSSNSSTITITLWCIGVTLYTHLVSFISVSYFDQIMVFWYLLLAMISAIEINDPRNNHEFNSVYAS